ncbi:probable serine/threonine-protein kinase PBL9 isoform X3 [Ricinus communis]|uniref:probable serine/threonine-protein kinase PBL9 isoform X3 n=1 Tax=Ricinus communis TaxID=3988 RepID=UPI00201B1AE6|nr:probable serine/threonine-protein kinase PBL9 isoform X3 [Ricinus communis]
MGLCNSGGIKSGSSVFDGRIWYLELSSVNSKFSDEGGKSTKTSAKVLTVTLPSTPQSKGEILESSNLKSFSFVELQKATRYFHRNNLLGRGGFGNVYRGFVNQDSLDAASPKTGISIAVKKMYQNGCQGQQEWLTEIKYLGQLCHPNLVRLIGYCTQEDHRLLVYEFMPNGSLDKHLYRKDAREKPLSWDLRMKVALGVAKGVAFLHNEAAQDFNVKISGFGLAKDWPVDDKTHVTTRVLGTTGYTAPEYNQTGHLTIKSDVYSFGVLLLELISGRPAVNPHLPNTEKYLVLWAMPFLSNKRKVFGIFDVCLEGKYVLSGALKAADLALRCLSKTPHTRPTMDEVVKVLEQIISEKYQHNFPPCFI